MGWGLVSCENLSHRPNYPPSLRPAGQMEVLASVAGIGVKREGCLLGDCQRFGIGFVAGFFAADA